MRTYITKPAMWPYTYIKSNQTHVHQFKIIIMFFALWYKSSPAPRYMLFHSPESHELIDVVCSHSTLISSYVGLHSCEVVTSSPHWSNIPSEISSHPLTYIVRWCDDGVFRVCWHGTAWDAVRTPLVSPTMHVLNMCAEDAHISSIALYLVFKTVIPFGFGNSFLHPSWGFQTAFNQGKQLYQYHRDCFTKFWPIML